MKRGMTGESRTTVCRIFRSGWRSSQILSKMQKMLALAHISQDSDSERATKVASKSRKDSIYSHFPKDRNCEVCLRTKNDKGSLQKRHWRSSTSSRKVRWLDNGWSQSPQWGGWITEQSPVRCRGTSSRHSLEFRVKPKLHRRRRRKLTETVAEAKSYSYRQIMGIWQVLWRIILESSNFDTSSIRDERYCCKSGTWTKRRNFSSFRIGWQVVVGFFQLSAITIWEMSKISWQTGKLKNEWRFGGSFQDMLCSWGETWEQDVLIAEIAELE